MRRLLGLWPLLLAVALAALPVPARGGEIVQYDTQETRVSLPSDPTIVQREERRADEGDLVGAIADLARYVAGHPSERAPMVLLGDLYYRARELSNAEGAYRQALALGNDRALHNRLGGVYVLEGRYDDAIREFRASLPLPGGFENLIALHRMRGDLAVFERQTVDEATRRPTDATAALDVALVYDAEGRDSQALAGYRHVLELDPNDAEAFNGIGSVLIAEHRYAEAITALRRALSLDAGYAPALCNLGDAYLGLHQVAEAQRNLERAIALDPENASTLVDLGVVEDTRGATNAALGDYRHAIAVDPFQLEAYYDMAADYDAQGQHLLAEAVTLKGLAIAPDDGILHYNLAVIEDELGRHGDAVTEYRRAAHLPNPEAARLARLALSAYDETTPANSPR